MKEIYQDYLTGERVLFGSSDLKIYDTVFDDGESPLKEGDSLGRRLCLRPRSGAKPRNPQP